MTTYDYERRSIESKCWSTMLGITAPLSSMLGAAAGFGIVGMAVTGGVSATAALAFYVDSRVNLTRHIRLSQIHRAFP